MGIQRVGDGDFEWSAASGPAAEVRRIADVATAYDGTSVLNEAATLQLKYRGLRGASLWVGDGGFALLHGDCVLDLAVEPDARGHGVGTALATAAVAGVTDAVSAWSHSDHPGAAAVAQRVGLARERELVIMRRELDGSIPEPRVADGVRVRTFRPGDEQALLAVNSSAFAHHPEQGHMSLDDFRERTQESWFDPEGLFLAVPDNEDDAPPDRKLLGFHWTKVHADEDPPYGEVYVVAANPKAAGRGIGSMLTNVGLRHLRDRGLTSVILYVDGDNSPALAVYDGQGFARVHSEVQYRGIPRVSAGPA